MFHSMVKPLFFRVAASFLLCSIIFCLMILLGKDEGEAADWSTDFKLKSLVEYNNNVLFARKNEIDDFILQASPSVKIHGKTERSSLTVSSLVQGKKYIDNSYLDTINTFNYVLLKRRITERFSSRLKTDFIKDETLEQELENVGRPGKRGTRYRYGFDLSGSYALSETIGIKIGGGPSFSDYPNNQYPDMDLWQAYMDNSWVLNPTHTIGLFLEYDDASYEDTSTTRTISSSLYCKRFVSEQTDITFGAGYRHTWTKYSLRYYIPVASTDGRTVFVPSRKKFSDTEDGFIFHARLKYRWNDRLATSMSAGREHYNTVDVRSIDRTYVRTTLDYALTEKTACGCSLSYDKTQDDLPKGLDSDNIKIEPYITLSLTNNMKLKIGGSYRYDKEKAAARDYHIERFKGWISFSYNIPRLFANH